LIALIVAMLTDVLSKQTYLSYCAVNVWSLCQCQLHVVEFSGYDMYIFHDTYKSSHLSVV